MNSKQDEKQNITEEQIRTYTKRLLLSRMRILDKHGFYGIMLMHIKFKLDINCPTAYTNASVIAFSPAFLDELNDDELDFVLMHEIMHVALKHCFRGVEYDPYIFNIATDIVVNSNILKSNNMNLNAITLRKYGEAMHIIDKEEGFNYTAEEVYEKLLKDKNVQKYLKNKKDLEEQIKEIMDHDDQFGNYQLDNNNQNDCNQNDCNQNDCNQNKNGLGKLGNSFDDHSKWQKKDGNQEKIDEINKLVAEAAASSKNRQAGSVPIGIEREIDNLLHPTIDWRTLLNDFVQQEINDYSFNPPDKRFDDTGFYLPDFNEPSETIEKILFMVDTSGSINYTELSQAYAEIKGVLEQFEHLKGYLGFFDYITYEPIEFDSAESLMDIKPKGGGGTNFHSIFNYIRNNMSDDLPKSVIIITDGYAPFPSEEECLHLPVLWLINNDVMTPTYGKVVRFNVKRDE